MSQDKPVTGKSSEKDKNLNKEISELTKSVFQGKLFLLRIPKKASISDYSRTGEGSPNTLGKKQGILDFFTKMRQP